MHYSDICTLGFSVCLFVCLFAWFLSMEDSSLFSRFHQISTVRICKISIISQQLQIFNSFHFRKQILKSHNQSKSQLPWANPIKNESWNVQPLSAEPMRWMPTTWKAKKQMKNNSFHPCLMTQGIKNKCTAQRQTQAAPVAKLHVIS